MDLIQAIALGIVQGITEFLPISSSAHLILTSKFLGWADQGINFDMAVHFGSLIAVIIYFNKQSLKLIKGKIDFIKAKKTDNAILFEKIIIATIPILIFALFMKNYIEVTFRDSVAIIGVTSIVWGILLYFADTKEEKINDIKQITHKTALLMGIAQALAIIPGTSRSGSTMTVARFLKFSRKSSAEFSMLMSIPVIIIMICVNMLEISLKNEFNDINLTFLIVGTITSFIFAILSIHLLMKLIDKIGFIPFVLYRITLGIIIFTYLV